MIREGFSGEGEPQLMWREEAYDQNGCMVADEGRVLGRWGGSMV